LDQTALRTCHTGTRRLCRCRALCAPCSDIWSRTSRLFASGSGRWGLGRGRSARRGWDSRSRSSGRGLLMAFSVGVGCGKCGLVGFQCELIGEREKVDQVYLNQVFTGRSSEKRSV
jgi:hypothetical protein